MQAEQFFKCVLESWLVFLSDEIFQMLRQLMIFKHRLDNVLVKESPRVTAPLNGLERLPDIFSDCDRPGSGFPRDGDRRALLFDVHSIFVGLGK